MYEVTVEHTFAAGHALRGYKGKCENIHGHNYRLWVTIAGEDLDETGILMDFVEVRALIKSVVSRIDHRFLNDFPPFDQINPSAENMAKFFYDEIEPAVRAKGLKILGTTIWETDTTSATYRPSSSGG